MAKKKKPVQKTTGPHRKTATVKRQQSWKSFWSSKQNLLYAAGILIITFITFLPSLQNGFVNWDDDKNIYENPHILETTNAETFFINLKGIFTTHVIGNYNPLSVFSFAMEKMIYGMENIAMWHFDNILLHLICVLLIFRIALALGLKIIPAAFCALLFGIQPMRVESVAWLTERKDVLFGTFYLFALYYYIKSVKLSFKKRYVFLIVISFILASLSKIQAVSLPLSMLAVDYFMGRKLSIKLIYEKWFYFFISLITGLVGIYFLNVQGSLDSNESFAFHERIFIGAYSYIVYIIKSLIPYRMIPMYPYPPSIGWEFYVSMIPSLAVVGSIYYFFKRQQKHIVFGLLFFTLNIMFMLQILSAGQGFIADRFTYIAYFGLFFIYAYLLQALLEKYKSSKKLILICCGLILGVYGYLNFQQNKIWKNGDTLWSHVIQYYTKATLPWGNRANYYRDHGQPQKALYDYSQTIALNTKKPEPFNSRGKLYFNSNNTDTLNLALQDYSKAILLAPEISEYYVNRGSTYARLQMYNEALGDLTSALKIDPNNPNVYFNRSIIYHNTRQYPAEIQDLTKYLTLKPYHADMWYNLAVANRITKQYPAALQAFERAVQLKPSQLAYIYDRSITHYEMGNIKKAKEDIDFIQANGFNQISPKYLELLNRAQ